MIQVTNLTYSYTGQPLYEHGSFSVPKNKKAGLVGLNGSGKSTLFKLILGEEYPEDGSVRVEGRVILVPQEVSSDPIQKKATSVREYLNKARRTKDETLLDLLLKMELDDVTLEDDPSNLSGGQKTKLAILFAVLSEPEVLLLDEPTNFLDTAGKKWVMHWLSQYKRTLLVVSHDLDLLDRHIHKVIYINKQTRTFEEYTGNYTQFKKLKADRDEHLSRYIKNQSQKIEKMKKSVEILRKSNVEKVIHQRVQLEKRLEKMQENLPAMPQELVRMKINIPKPAHCGVLPIWVQHVSKSYDNHPIIHDLSFSLKRGERFALIGKNGAGKSTLIKTILGLVELTSGSIKLDDNIKIGYYSQEFETFNFDQTLFSTVQEQTDLTDGQIRSFLARFMFSKQALNQKIGSLSGGEKTRLSIALLLLKNNNLLILDEPTTYLDVLSQRIILEALKAYTGTMIIVSHTPEFLIELKPHKAILLPEEKVVFWNPQLAVRSRQQ